MRSFTRVLLPILLVAGVVFGLTFIMIHSPDDESGAGSREAKDRKGPGAGPPLKFFTLKAAVPREERNEETGQVRLTGPVHLKYWDSEVEVGAPGHYPFWCQNRHDQPVTVRVPSTNCQCAGVDLAVVPATAGSPGSPSTPRPSGSTGPSRRPARPARSSPWSG
jgi:hypothetical protein